MVATAMQSFRRKAHARMVGQSTAESEADIPMKSMTHADIWAAYQSLAYSSQKKVRITRAEILAIKRALPDADDIDRWAKMLADRYGLTHVQAVEILHGIGLWLARQDMI